jgi:hypothetical protein
LNRDCILLQLFIKVWSTSHTTTLVFTLLLFLHSCLCYGFVNTNVPLLDSVLWVSVHASNFNSRFVSMSELELFMLMGVLTPNFNTMDLVKILGKNQKLHIQIVAVTLKVTPCKTMSKKIKWNKVKTKILWAKQKKILAPCPSALGQFQPHGCM